jgi:hypothetical protein
MAQISHLEAQDLLSKLLAEQVRLVAFFRSPRVEIRLAGFVDSLTTANGITISLSRPPIDVSQGYLTVRGSQGRCDFWYGDKHEMPKHMYGFSDTDGESVLAIRFLEFDEALALFFTL